MTVRSARARAIAVTVVAGAILAATPSAAQAAKPFRIPGALTVTSMTFGNPGDISDPCGFPIVVVFTSREALTFFSSGALLITGSFKVSVTNQGSGKVLAVNASGPGRTDAAGNSSGTGPQIYLLGPDEALGGGIYLFHGATSFTRDGAGLIDSITAKGTRSGNLCATIA